MISIDRYCAQLAHGSSWVREPIEPGASFGALLVEGTEMTALVIYHANCYDGFTAAWIARQAMPDCELFEGRYGEEPPYEKAQERKVYIVDFSYPRDQMVKLLHYTGATGSLLVLDHHKTAEANCKGLAFCEFDMERSGCGMTWEHFFADRCVPAWINRIEDRDLWQFRFDDTKEVHAYVASLPMTMENWDALDKTSLQTIAECGRIVLGYIQTYIGKAVKESRVVGIDTYTEDHVAVLNVPYQNASETADAMLKKYPDVDYAMSYFQRADGKWQYSLRSRSSFDVSRVAVHHGGGGHAQAAGFETRDLLPELVFIPTPS